MEDGSPNYELDPESWDAAELFWRQELERLEASIGQVGQWLPWEPKVWGDGVTPTSREDRSICEGRSETLDRSFRILEHALVDGKPFVVAWVKDYENDAAFQPLIERESPRFPRAMLVIDLARTDETIDAARSLLRRWMEPQTTVMDMGAFIDEVTFGVY